MAKWSTLPEPAGERSGGDLPAVGKHSQPARRSVPSRIRRLHRPFQREATAHIRFRRHSLRVN
jgi:hypothetical protein